MGGHGLWATSERAPLWGFFLDRRFVLAELSLPLSLYIYGFPEFSNRDSTRLCFYSLLKTDGKTRSSQLSFPRAPCNYYGGLWAPQRWATTQGIRKRPLWFEPWRHALSYWRSSHLRDEGYDLPSNFHSLVPRTHPPHPKSTQPHPRAGLASCDGCTNGSPECS